jgi:uncharacterized membrane protein YfcA
VPLELVALIAPIVFVAYAVFGLTGFGAAVVAVPVMVQLVPLQFAVPMIALFDLVCTALVGGSNWRRVSGAELRRILPWMVLGVVAGTTLLHNVGAKWPLIALGTFVLLLSLRNLTASAIATKTRIAGGWVLPFGVAGGVFSALFGTGGPIYTIYLSRRLPDLDRFRATISVVILFSGISRVVAFGAAGLYGKDSILQAAMVLLPVCLLGVFAGSKLRKRVAPDMIKRAIFMLLAVAGAGAIYRGVMSPV